jgi:hypothetical protein
MYVLHGHRSTPDQVVALDERSTLRRRDGGLCAEGVTDERIGTRAHEQSCRMAIMGRRSHRACARSQQAPFREHWL